jgi:uncharacterized membrane protein
MAASKSTRGRKATPVRAHPTAPASTAPASTLPNGKAPNGKPPNGNLPNGKASGSTGPGSTARGDVVATKAAGKGRPASASTRTGSAPPPSEYGNEGAPIWLQLTTFALSLLGLGVSVYETYSHFVTHSFLGCSGNGTFNCEAVTTSAQSYVGPSNFHVPVAVLGVLFFVFAAVPLMSPWAWQAKRREIHLARLVSLIIGMCFVLYLLYAELIIIGKICIYCTSVHILTFLLFVLTVGAAALWGLAPGRPGFPVRKWRAAAEDSDS